MKEIYKIINENQGYHVYESFVPRILISDFRSQLKNLHPVRAILRDKTYVEGQSCQKSHDMSVWWSQTVENLKEFERIFKLVDPIITSNFSNLQFYASDVVTVNAGSDWINPHVDTPHRFEKWNFDKRLLGIQCIISLEDTTTENASTGLVPFSQKRDFNIKQCYAGEYNKWFLSNCLQPKMPKGSLLIYNCRVLHSSMPNKTQIDRPALLINFLDKTIINEVSSIDNIWKSNGKRP